MLRIPKNLPFVRYRDARLEISDNTTELLRQNPDYPPHVHSPDVERLFVNPKGLYGRYEPTQKEFGRGLRTSSP